MSTWVRTRDSLPPKDTELLLFKDGKQWKAKLDIFEIVDGRGGYNPNIPEYWAYPVEGKEMPDPDWKPKGIDHVQAQTQEDRVDPKLDKEGKAPEVGVETYGHDGFANR